MLKITIVGSAEEVSLQRPLALVIHLPADQLPAQGLPGVREATHNYFAHRTDQESHRLRLLFRDGRIALLIGLGFLFCCMLLRELAFSFGSDSASDIFGEGMLIIGWVAMWRLRCRWADNDGCIRVSRPWCVFQSPL
jgi:hypothetical protein